jgi:PAS domain S-box-containing protein
MSRSTTTKKPLRVLMVEDNPDDAELLRLALVREGYEVFHERVETGDAMRAMLAERPWDIVVSDFSLPTFDAPSALAVLRASGLDIPFLVVSGTVGEEAAVDALKSGAHDFMLKGKLARLGPAIERALRERVTRDTGRATERALRESETRLRRLTESGLVGITVEDADGRIVEANDAFLQMVGYTRQDVAAGALRRGTLTPPEHAPLEAFAREQLDAAGVARPWEQEFFRKEGERVPVLVGVTALEPPRAIAVVIDLSERRKMETTLRRTEEQLRQAQKMEAIGNLAGGVAHDFNNLLSVILSYSSMMSQDMTPSDPRRADLEEIEGAGRRAVDLTRQLLAFSRQQILQPRIVNLNDIVMGLERMLRRLIGEDVELAVLCETPLGEVKVDPGQVEQIIMNLAVNSRDAMPDGGKLTIETGNVDLDAKYASEHVGAAVGPHVMLAVTDTGVGMDRVTQARMFEPFFSTKEKGKGTGLGLATVFGIVQQSGGNVWVYSEPGKGTTIKVYFPRTDRRTLQPEPRPSVVPATGKLTGTETILLVEDEERVRVLIRTILRRFGYHVIEGQTGGDALLVCEQHKAKIHLLLTDVVMPRLSGRQLAERIRGIRPEMKVLYMSGYTDNSIVHHGVLDSDVAFLQKPITPESLLRKVREVLDS